MANTINTMSKLWILDTTDMVSGTPICVRKIQMIATAAADVGTFYSLAGSVAADHDNYFTNLNFDSNTYTITDAATGDKWTNIAANDWVHVTECGEPLNDGWYYLKTDGGNSTFDIEHSKFPLTEATGVSARIQTYTPEISMKIIADTDGGSGTPIHHPVLDWGDKGRWFENLSFLEGSSDTLEIYLYIK